MNFTHLTLHYLVKIETSKTHVSTNSAFNQRLLQTSRQMHQITLTVSQNVLMIQINNNFAACVQSVRHQHASNDLRLVNRSLDNVLFSQPKFA